MPESLAHQVRNDGIRPGGVHLARGKPVASRDNFRAANVDEGDRLGVARFEADGGARRDVEPLTICLAAIERECRVRLDEVVVGTNLPYIAAELQNTLGRR